VDVHKLLGFVASIVSALKSIAPALALRLNFACGHVADSCMEEADGYDFFAQAFVTYEEDISDSREQLAALTLASATLHHTNHFTAESYDTLATKATQYSARLLKKPDQCRAVAKASLLFTTSSAHVRHVLPSSGDASVDQESYGELANPNEAIVAGREPRRVLECLQRALKIADACKASHMHLPLFVETLDSYLFHYAGRSPAVSAKYITSLLQLIEQSKYPEDEVSPQVLTHFDNTKAFIKRRFDQAEFDQAEV